MSTHRDFQLFTQCSKTKDAGTVSLVVHYISPKVLFFLPYRQQAQLSFTIAKNYFEDLNKVHFFSIYFTDFNQRRYGADVYIDAGVRERRTRQISSSIDEQHGESVQFFQSTHLPWVESDEYPFSRNDAKATKELFFARIRHARRRS